MAHLAPMDAGLHPFRRNRDVFRIRSRSTISTFGARDAVPARADSVAGKNNGVMGRPSFRGSRCGRTSVGAAGVDGSPHRGPPRAEPRTVERDDASAASTVQTDVAPHEQLVLKPSDSAAVGSGVGGAHSPREEYDAPCGTRFGTIPESVLDPFCRFTTSTICFRRRLVFRARQSTPV